jgi:pimeloyl-ACP methyl ester carboxylesterase
MRLLRLARLLRWLGPWAAPDAAPGGVVRREVAIVGPRPLRAWTWRRDDEPPSGSLLLVPGLHFLGPADPRFDRFGRILAHAGFLVLAPFLPDFERLVVGRQVVPDTERALDALLAHPERPPPKPGAFSVSFGSMPALRLAAARSGDLASLIVFGGFADFRRTLRFALTGEGGRAHDPLNAPAVFINLVDYLGVDEADRTTLCCAWREQCKRTWGKEENKRPEVYRAVARELAAKLPPRLRDLFLLGARAHPAGDAETVACALAALERAGNAFDWIDPRPHLAGIRCEVHLVHGRDDDVIPFEESEALARALPSDAPARRHLTGLYGHTRSAGVAALAGHARAAAREVEALFGILSAIAGASRP